MKRLILILCMHFVLLVVCDASADQGRIRITTSDGRGADSTIQVGNTGTDPGEQPFLGLQQSMPSTDVGQKIYLRFDLSPLVGEDVESAFLTLEPLAGYNIRCDFNVFGLREADDGSDVAWSTGDGDGRLAWTNAPAHDPSNTGGAFEVSEIQDFNEIEKKSRNGNTRILKQLAGVRREIINNGGVHADASTYLGKIRIGPESVRCRLVGDDLAHFLNADRDGVVTMVLTLANTPGKTILFASGEHPFLDPPSLWIAATKKRSIIAKVEAILSSPLTIGNEVERLDVWYSRIALESRQEGWFDSREDVHRLYKQLEKKFGGASEPNSNAAAALSLVDLLRVEADFMAKELTKEEWAGRVATILGNHRERADDLLYAYYALTGDSYSEQSSGSAAGSKIDLFMEQDLPPRAINAAIVLLTDRAVDSGVANALSYYRALIPAAYGMSTPPYVVYRYAETLKKAEGIEAARYFLDQATSLKPHENLGQAAAVLRVSYEPDPSQKADLLARLVESNVGPVADVLRPYYLTNQSRNGQLFQALIQIDPSLGELRNSNLKAWGGAVVDSMYRVLNDVDVSLLSLMADSEELDLGELLSPRELSFSLAQQFYNEGRYAEAIALAIGLMDKSGIVLHGLSLDVSSASDAVWLLEGTEEDRQAGAALLLHVIHGQGFGDASSQGYLNEASSLSTTARIKALVLFHKAVTAVSSGNRVGAKMFLDEAWKNAPRSEALKELRALLDSADGE